MPKKVEISHKTIVFVALFLLGLWFLYFIRDLILGLFVAFLLMTILQPMVVGLTKVKIPRGISIFVSYIIFFGILGGAISLVIPPLIDQTTSFVSALPTYLIRIGVSHEISQGLVNQTLSQLGAIPGEILKFVLSLFSNILSVVMVLVFSVYMLIARERLNEGLGAFFGEEMKEDLIEVITNLETRLGKWARGEMFLMILVGVSTFIGLSLLGIPFALPLSILAGLLEIVPNLGPTIAAIPSIIIGLGISPLTGLGVAGLAILVQQVENYLFVPKVMEKSVGVSPLVTLLALAIGARLAGVVGAIISVPTVITLQVILKKYFVKD
jgi:predicted PurR-regulated permease PerM